MSFPKILAYQQAAAAETAQASSGTTAALTAHAGDSIYVFVSYATGPLGNPKVSSVTDSSGNPYVRGAIVQNLTNQDGTSGHYLAEEIWYADNVPANAALTVTVTFSSSTFFVFNAVDISGAAGVSVSRDVFSSGQTGSGTSSSDPISCVSPNDLVIALFCGFRLTGTPTSAGGFTATFSGVSGGNTTTPKDITSNGFYYDAASAGIQNSSISWTTAEPYAIVTVAIKSVEAWVNLQGKPVVTVSPIGLGTSPPAAIANDGADFGPDTAGTQTSGIQEALNSVATSGGTVYCRRGAYSLSAPIYNTGNFQTVVFAAGTVLTFSPSGSYQNWFTWDVGDIWVGCNFVTASGGTGQETYHDCAWYGNGTTIQCSGQSVSNTHGEQVFVIVAYTQSAYPDPGYNLTIDGFTANGFGGAALEMVNYSGAGGAAYSQQWRRVIVRRLTATMAQNTHSSPFGSGIVVGGSNGVVFEDLYVDCSNVQSTAAPDVSNCYITSTDGGDTQSITFKRCYFKSGGGSGSANPGSVLEAQGSDSATASTHEILFEDCVFDSGASSGSPVGGAGGIYIDDGSAGYIFNTEFRRCQFIHCGCEFQSRGSKFGYLRFVDGGMPGAFQGSLQGRGPKDGGVAITVVASGTPLEFVYTNDDGIDEDVIVSGGSPGSNGTIYLNGYDCRATLGTFRVRPGDTLTLHAWPNFPSTIQKQAR